MDGINWELLINSRRSARSFYDISIESEQIDKLRSLIDQMEVPFNHSVEIRFFKAEHNKKLYTMFNSPKDNMAFISETDYVSISKAGFVGEIAVLYATHLGLATCWFGHYTLMELEKQMPHLEEHIHDDNPKWGYGKNPVDGERAICITPIAYYKEKGMRVIDRMQMATMSFKRKPIGELINKDASTLPEHLTFALDMARKAPSGGNSQSWRFKISEDNKVIELAMPVGYKHIKWEHPNVDIGICACHFWVGLNIKNVKCNVNIKEDQDRAVWIFNLLD